MNHRFSPTAASGAATGRKAAPNQLHHPGEAARKMDLEPASLHPAQDCLCRLLCRNHCGHGKAVPCRQPGFDKARTDQPHIDAGGKFDRKCFGNVVDRSLGCRIGLPARQADIAATEPNSTSCPPSRTAAGKAGDFNMPRMPTAPSPRLARGSYRPREDHRARRCRSPRPAAPEAQAAPRPSPMFRAQDPVVWSARRHNLPPVHQRIPITGGQDKLLARPAPAPAAPMPALAPMIQIRCRRNPFFSRKIGCNSRGSARESARARQWR